MAYLLCDVIAAIALGLISKRKGNATEQPTAGRGEEEFMAFWASFLLLHLGGPDTITSFAIEDNQFWFRHFTGLVFRFVSTTYIFYQTFPENNYKLWIPTAMVFVAGTIRYTERTRSLYLASSGSFGRSALPKPHPWRDYEDLVEEFSHHIHQPDKANDQVVSLPLALEGYSKSTGDKQELIKLVQKAHNLFERFKGLIVGYLLSTKEREMSRQFFHTIDATQAFNLIACELNFMYDLLHTKVVVARSKLGYIFRFITASSILIAFMVFRSIEKQHKFESRFDTKLSYALLIGALGFEATSVLMLIFSDWTLITMKSSTIWCNFIPNFILRRHRWSRSISGYDMITYCLKAPPAWLSKLATDMRLGIVLHKFNIMFHSDSDKVTGELQNFIFNQLKMKSSFASSLNAAIDACSQRGDWALMQTSCSFKLKWSIDEYQYAESVLLWHLATELLYHTDPSYPDQKKKKLKSCLPWPKKKTPNNSRPDHHNEPSCIEICKRLSDYMFYLLVMQPAMMAPVLGNWQIAFQDTHEDANGFFRKKQIKRGEKRRACEEILKVRTLEYRLSVVSESKSLLFDAGILAKQLLKLKINKWMVMSRVWVELMSYAAIKCLPLVHAKQPSRGGELLTFVWLLMNHLGLGAQFSDDQTGTKKIDPIDQHDGR